MQHGFTVAAAAAAAAATDSSSSSSDSDNNRNAFAPPGAATLSRAPSATPPPLPPPPSLGALGAALASADAEAEGEGGDETDSDSEEACDAFSPSSSEEGEGSGGAGGASAPFAFSVDVVGTRHRTPAVRALARAVVRGLRSGPRAPSGPSPEGLGGSYVFADERGRPAAIVKPCDEEPLAPNNPKGFVGRELGDPGLRPTVRVGQAALREVAAYLLDHGGLARVPPTVLVRVAHPVFHVAKARAAGAATGRGRGEEGGGDAPPSAGAPPSAPPPPSLLSAATAPPSLLSLSLGPPQTQEQQSEQRRYFRAAAGAASASSPPPARSTVGDRRRRRGGPGRASLTPKLASLQQYVRHDGDAADAGASRFSVRDVHAIGILDIRLLNSDRHAGNLLVRRRREGDEGGGEEQGAAAAGAAAPPPPPPPPSRGERPPQQQQQQHPSTSLLARFDAAAARAARNGRPPLELVPIDHGASLALASSFQGSLSPPVVFFRGRGNSLFPRPTRAHARPPPHTHTQKGFSLPDDGLEPLFLEWLHWPQSSVPFSQRELEYIARLDGDADAALLARELPDLAGGGGGGGTRGSCLRCLSVSTRLLQRCAAAGLTLADIGALASRPLVGMEEEPSQLERVCWGARAEVNALRRRASAKARAAEEAEGEAELLSAAVDARGQGQGGLLAKTQTPARPRPPPSVAAPAATPASTSLGAVSTPALVSGGAGAARRRGSGEGDSSSSSPPPPLSFLSSLNENNGTSRSSGDSRSDSGNSLPPLLPLASQASSQSHPEDLLFELEGAAAAASNGQQQQQQRDKRFPSDNGAHAAPASPLPSPRLPLSLSPPAPQQQSLNPATGGAWSPVFRGSVLPGSSAESVGGSRGGPLASPTCGTRSSSSFGSLPPVSPRPLSSQHSLPPPTSPGPPHLRGAPLGTSLAGAGFGGGGGGGARGGGGAAAEAAAASDNAAAAGFARRPATARERLRARALAALGGSGSAQRRKKGSVCFTADGDDARGDTSDDGGGGDDCLPPPGVSSARVFAGLEGDEWAAFVEAFDERVCAALRAGIWRNIAAAGGVVSAAKKGKAPAGGGGGGGGGGVCGGGGKGGAALGVSCPRF